MFHQPDPYGPTPPPYPPMLDDRRHEQAYPGAPVPAPPIGFGFETSPYPAAAMVPAEPYHAYPDPTFCTPEIGYGYQAPAPPYLQASPYAPGGPVPTYGQSDQYSSTYPPHLPSPEAYQTQDHEDAKWRSGGGIPGGKAGVVGGAVAAGLGTALATQLLPKKLKKNKLVKYGLPLAGAGAGGYVLNQMNQRKH